MAQPHRTTRKAALPSSHPHPPSFPPSLSSKEMVCDTCEKKLGKLCVPDKWKEGSRNVTGASAAASGSGPPGSINKLAEKRKARLAEAGGGGGVGGRQCRICKVRVMDVQRHYCNGCAYKVRKGGREGGREEGVVFVK